MQYHKNSNDILDKNGKNQSYISYGSTKDLEQLKEF
jgi:hypothetical protein